jgi:cell division protein FtsB
MRHAKAFKRRLFLDEAKVGAFGVGKALILGAILFFGGWLLYSIVSGYIQDRNMAQQVSVLSAQNAAIAKQDLIIRKQLAIATTPQNIEEQERLQGYVKPGEKVFVVVGNLAPNQPVHKSNKKVKSKGGLLYDILSWIKEVI